MTGCGRWLVGGLLVAILAAGAPPPPPLTPAPAPRVPVPTPLPDVRPAPSPSTPRPLTPADHLLHALKAAPDEQAAEALEAQVEKLWLQAGSPAVTLLMSRGLRLLHANEYGAAVQAFSAAITLDPTLAEAWHQRAIARYESGNFPGALQDVEETLKLEPRDFAAFRTLSEFAEARGDWKAAYAAWLRVLDLDPKTPGGDERRRMLKRKALGEST